MNDDKIDIFPIRMLCVDDEPNVLKALKRVFRGSNYQVSLAESGFKGLEILAQGGIDIIISDMRMPQMDGAEFLAKAARQWPEVMRILLTGYADIESTIAAVNQGKIYSYCSKPWEDEELKTLIHKAVEEKRMREERVQLFEIIHQQNAQLTEFNKQLEDKVQQRTQQLKKSFKQLDSAHKNLKKQYIDSIRVFAKIIEMRPGIRSGHSSYIANYGKSIAERLQLTEEQQKQVLYAGLLLQIGKMGLPEELLQLPLFQMSTQDKAQYYKHALEGESLLKQMAQLTEAASFVKHQFENYDGSGYPDGLRASEIPTGSRILAIVRDYLSFLEGSMSGDKMSVANAQLRLQEKKGLLYDPLIVDAFLAVLMETNMQQERPIVEISCTQLVPGMEIAEIYNDDRLYLKNFILEKKNIDDIIMLWKQARKKLTIKIRLGENSTR